ncbi:MAG: SDR family oxidoreductase [Alphaproteobacteria bacterium]|nr:SDR family oxidoreductase [Alphaproteobacteria bacterium]
MAEKTAVVVGARGMIGRATIDALERANDWNIVAVSRKRPDYPSRAEHVAVDLEDRADAERKLGGLSEVTHVFYSALNGSIAAENVAGNLELVRNSIGVLARSSRKLERVVLGQGGKYYGCHLGPHRTPSLETDPRHLPPNFYYAQQDFVVEAQRGQSWSYALIRPEAVVGTAHGIPLNVAGQIAAYALICKHLEVPFHYPGPDAAFRAYNKFTDAKLLGRFLRWAATAPVAANQAYNITGDSGLRFCNIWPFLTQYFGLRRGEVMPFSLVSHMEDKEEVWQDIVRKHGLKPTTLSDFGDWVFGDWIFGRTWDTILEDTKRIKAGFTEVIDSQESFQNAFDQMRAERLIP